MRKYWFQLLLCALLSAGIWLIHNLSQTYVSIVSMPVQARSSVPAHDPLSINEATVTAQVRASGYSLLSLSRRHKKAKVVDFDSADLRQDTPDSYSCQNSTMIKYSGAIFGERVSVESFVSDAPQFVFQQVAFRKLPVRSVASISYAPQYTALKPMRLQPDSVYVYGDPTRLQSVTKILTKPVDLSLLSSSVHGKVKLDVPAGLKLSEQEVIYYQDVTRYVELRSEVKIKTVNVPEGMKMNSLPSSAEVVLRSVFPVPEDPFRDLDLYVDYQEYLGSINGKCMIHSNPLPSWIISCSIEPQFTDCIVLSNF
ncbi:MAG: CdaR family protein [Candidatus Cryptobacteroides sp.]